MSFIYDKENTAAGAKTTANLVGVVTPEKANNSGNEHVKKAVSSLQAPVDLPKVVNLNVGGFKFTTTRETLCRVKGSHLEAMFSGRHAMEPLQNNDEFFIDRDGSLFSFVLNFLRAGGVVALPIDHVAKEQLAIEADFYGLVALVKAIRIPKIDVTECLPAGTLAQWEAEAELRAAFVDGTAKNFTDKFRGLIPLFPAGDQETPLALPLKYNPESEVRKSPLFMDQIRPTAGNTADSNVTVQSLNSFQTNFNKEWPNILTSRLNDVLIDGNVIIAGGSVLRAMTASEGIRTADWWGDKASDIDIFFYGCDEEKANLIARRIFYSLAVDNERWVVMRSRGVINMVRWSEGRRGSVETKVQVVLRLYDSPAEVLVGFDIDCCCCAYDGRNVWVSPRWISAIESGVNVMNPLHAWPNKPSYELRLAKYAFRGFAACVPGFDMSRIDYNLIHRSDLYDLKGLARLLKVASEMESATPRKKHVWDRNLRQHQTTERPRVPGEVATLREEDKRILSDDERLIGALDLSYDDPLDAKVLVPSVYPRSGFHEDEGVLVADPWMWVGYSTVPLSRDTRDAAWEEILNAGEDSPAPVSRHLKDAWANDKRSREYLNSSLDKYDLDNLYYSKACKEDPGDCKN